MNEIDKWIEYIKERASFYGHDPEQDKDVNGKIKALRKTIPIPKNRKITLVKITESKLSHPSQKLFLIKKPNIF